MQMPETLHLFLRPKFQAQQTFKDRACGMHQNTR